MILFVKNIDIEGPETLGVFFDKNNIKTQTIELDQGESLPKDLTGIEAVVVFGGPMNVYEEDKFPYLKQENEFIQKILDANIPYLGLCLGSQLLAKASGAKVVRSPEQEIGFSFVEVSEEGKQDPLFAGLNPKINVFQWHGDMFEIPENGKLLASSSICPHQAFKVGDNAYGLQFHVEITDKSIKEWSDRYFDQSNAEAQSKKKEMVDDYNKYKEEFNHIAETFYKNFLTIILSKN